MITIAYINNYQLRQDKKKSKLEFQNELKEKKKQNTIRFKQWVADNPNKPIIEYLINR